MPPRSMGFLLRGITVKRVNDQIASEVRKSLGARLLNLVDGQKDLMFEDVTNCDISRISPRVNSNIKSGGNLSRFRLTPWFSTRVSTPYNSAKSRSNITFSPRMRETTSSRRGQVLAFHHECHLSHCSQSSATHRLPTTPADALARR